MGAPLRVGSVVEPSKEGIRRYGMKIGDVGIVTYIDGLDIAVARFNYRTIWRGHPGNWKRATRSDFNIWIDKQVAS